jgi:putative addiction module component (TIGR02574 family)
MSKQELFAKAMELPAGEREALAIELLDTVFPGEPVDEAEWIASWAPELERRLKQVEDGTAVLIPAEEVLADLRKRLAERR